MSSNKRIYDSDSLTDLDEYFYHKTNTSNDHGHASDSDGESLSDEVKNNKCCKDFQISFKHMTTPAVTLKMMMVVMSHLHKISPLMPSEETLTCSLN